MRPFVLRIAAFAFMACAVLLAVRAAGAASAHDTLRPAFDRALLRVANQLDAAAAEQRRNPHRKIKVSDFHIPPAPLGGAPMYSPSLDQWLQSSLAEIRMEKPSKVRGRDLADLALALRRAAESNNKTTSPAVDPASETGRILAQKPYQTGGAGPAPTPQESLWERFLRWLGGLLENLFRRIFGAAASAPLIGQIVAGLFILLVAAVASYLVYVLVTLAGSRRRSRALDDGAPLEVRIDPDTLYQRGLAAAAAGLYAQAIALLFAASLASFERAGKLDFDAARTAGENRRAVRRAFAAASPHFDSIAQAFVLAAFSEKPISQADWTAADAAYHSLQPLLAS